MSSIVPDVIEGRTLAQQAPPGSRPLGVRVKPRIRLGMGHKNERGYPVKDDHFTVRGDDQAVQKFLRTFGDEARAIPILLPSSLDQALSIQYRAFKSAGDDEGGVLTAVGETNFALRDYVGGPDIIRHFAQNGDVEDLETAGLDANTRQPLDETAAKLGIEHYTTLRAGMPDVLGFGSYFEVTTKGKESTDSLWLKLRELYGLFGSRVTFAVKPNLILRPSSARPVVEKNGEKKRIKTTIYVLDIVVPKSIDEMIQRLAERQASLGDPTVAVYGRVAGELPPARSSGGAPPEGAEAPSPTGDDVPGTPPDERQQAGPEETPSADEPSGPVPGGCQAAHMGAVCILPAGHEGHHRDSDGSFWSPFIEPTPEPPAPEPAAKPPKRPNLNQAATTVITSGRYSGKTIKQVHKDENDPGYIGYLCTAPFEATLGLTSEEGAQLRLAARVYAEKQLPEALKAAASGDTQEPQA